MSIVDVIYGPTHERCAWCRDVITIREICYHLPRCHGGADEISLRLAGSSEYDVLADHLETRGNTALADGLRRASATGLTYGWHALGSWLRGRGWIGTIRAREASRKERGYAVIGGAPRQLWIDDSDCWEVTELLGESACRCEWWDGSNWIARIPKTAIDLDVIRRALRGDLNLGEARRFLRGGQPSGRRRLGR